MFCQILFACCRVSAFVVCQLLIVRSRPCVLVCLLLVSCGVCMVVRLFDVCLLQICVSCSCASTLVCLCKDPRYGRVCTICFTRVSTFFPLRTTCHRIWSDVRRWLISCSTHQSGGADPRHGSLGDGQVVGHASRGTCRVRATQGRVLPVVPVTRRQMMAFLWFTTSTQHTRNHIFVFGKKRRQRIRGLV